MVGDRLAGVLLGTAIGDALGLPMEGMSASAIARSFPAIDRYHLLGGTGFVSDDTEQTALVAESLAKHPNDVERCVRAFRRSLLGWFLRLPWGIGFGTLKACLRIGLGFQSSGVRSAGNGAAMRAAIVGAFFFDDAGRRKLWGEALAQVTHVDPRAVEGARYVAEVAAHAISFRANRPCHFVASLRSGDSSAPSDRAIAASEGDSANALVEMALSVLEEPSLRASVQNARRLAQDGVSSVVAGRELGTTGFVNHTVAITTFCLLRFGNDPERAIVSAIRAGGDTDSNAAIVGAWMGALHGERGLPSRLIAKLNDGPFGASHLRALARDLERVRAGDQGRSASYAWAIALARNLALYPVVLAHAFRVFFSRAADHGE